MWLKRTANQRPYGSLIWLPLSSKSDTIQKCKYLFEIKHAFRYNGSPFFFPKRISFDLFLEWDIEQIERRKKGGYSIIKILFIKRIKGGGHVWNQQRTLGLQGDSQFHLQIFVQETRVDPYRTSFASPLIDTSYNTEVCETQCWGEKRWKCTVFRSVNTVTFKKSCWRLLGCGRMIHSRPLLFWNKKKQTHFKFRWFRNVVKQTIRAGVHCHLFSSIQHVEIKIKKKHSM